MTVFLALATILADLAFKPGMVWPIVAGRHAPRSTRRVPREGRFHEEPVVLVDVDQVDVRGDIEFAGAELAHAHDPEVDDLAGLKRQVLVTGSAWGLYRKFGFEVLDEVEATEATARLLREGYSREDLAKLWGGNALRVLGEAVNRLLSPDRALLVITHFPRLLETIRPDVVHVLSKGRIVKTGGKELALELEAQGYAQFQDDAA